MRNFILLICYLLRVVLLRRRAAAADPMNDKDCIHAEQMLRRALRRRAQRIGSLRNGVYHAKRQKS